jgi:hypothetical protein
LWPDAQKPIVTPATARKGIRATRSNTASILSARGMEAIMTLDPHAGSSLSYTH